MDKTGAIEKVERNGKTYLQLKDFAEACRKAWACCWPN